MKDFTIEGPRIDFAEAEAKTAAYLSQITDEQGQHIRQLRLLLIKAVESFDSNSAIEIEDSIRAYMKRNNLTGLHYMHWNRANPVRKPDATNIVDAMAKLKERAR